ncbi:hypothetical protein POM88_019338 [Heracleum sosnowskyi]|uniref:Uncharacterized protein n=1 Tax=Heracleum sosnowskyi TaxID=360622 RepID=A0AAD8ISQ7_9APIA|nr:hypothetical protein POM88_019338 [Heracleum sosnowskyi]
MISLSSFNDIFSRDKGNLINVPDDGGLGLLRKKKLKDMTNNLCNRALKQKKVDDSTNNSCQVTAYKGDLDWKKLDLGIWSIKPINLKVNPGSEVILENILLNEAQRVSKRSLIKEWQEEYNDKYVCIFILSLSSTHEKSTVLDTIMLRDVHHQIESSDGKFKVICVPTHFQAEFERERLECDDIYNPYQQHLTLKMCTPFHDIHIDNHTCLKQIASTIGLPKDEDTTHVILGPTNGSCRKVVSIFDSDFIKWYGAEAYPFTTKKIQQLEREDEAMRKSKHDLGTLLCRPDRDFVISNDCTKVPISELQHKTVCLLFYEDHMEGRKRIEELKQVYELRKDFEVVVVFPVTFGQHANINSVNFNKWRRELEFWKDTGFTNYPFSGEEVVPSAIAIRGKKLSSVLEPNIELVRARDLDDAKGLEEFKVSRLLWVPVIFLFVRASGFSEFLSRLQYYHLVASWTIDKFEVVYIPMIESAPDIACHWMLTSPSAESKENLIPLFDHFFEDKITQNDEKEFTMATLMKQHMSCFGKHSHLSTTKRRKTLKVFVLQPHPKYFDVNILCINFESSGCLSGPTIAEKAKLAGLINGAHNILQDIKLLKEMHQDHSEAKKLRAMALVTLPQVGSLVYYFPQGHSEQNRNFTDSKLTNSTISIIMPSSQCYNAC